MISIPLIFRNIQIGITSLIFNLKKIFALKKQQKQQQSKDNIITQGIASVVNPINNAIKNTYNSLLFSLALGLGTAGSVLGLLFALFHKGKIGLFIIITSIIASISGYYYLKL